MRWVAFVLGGLLVLGGGALIVIADQERTAAVVQARKAVESAEQRLESARSENLMLAERLTALRSAIADQDDRLAQTEGFLE